MPYQYKMNSFNEINIKNYEIMKKNEELWNKIRDIIRSNNLDSYDEKYVKIKFNSDDDLHFRAYFSHLLCVEFAFNALFEK